MRRGIDRLVEVDRDDDLRAVRRVGDERRRVRRRARPSRRAPTTTRACGRRPRRGRRCAFIHSSWFSSSSRVASAGVFSVWFEPRVVDRVLQGEELGDVAVRSRRCARRARSRRGRRARTRGRRRRRSSSAARSSRRRSRRRRRRCRRPRSWRRSTVSAPASPATRRDRGHDAGRGLVVRPGVDVDAVDAPRARCAMPARRLRDVGRLEPRRGRGGRRTSRRTRRRCRCCAAASR